MNDEIQTIRNKTSNEIEALQNKTNKEIEALQNKTNKEIEALQNQMKKKIQTIRNKYTKLKKNNGNKTSKRRAIPKTVKTNLWDKYIGTTKREGECYVCHKLIKIEDFHCGHVISVNMGGSDSIDNLRPICSKCNLSMGTRNLEDFKKEYFGESNKKTNNIQKNNNNIQKNNNNIQKKYTNNLKKQQEQISKISKQFSIVYNLIRDINVKSLNSDNNLCNKVISDFTKSNMFLDQYITNIPGIINIHYLKQDKLENVISSFSCNIQFINDSILLCHNKYGIPDINDRIKFIKIIIDEICYYNELSDKINLIFPD